jgi:hypothetical protein
MNNELISIGKILEIEKDSIKIGNKTGKMPIVKIGTPVKVNVHNSKNGFRTLMGKVYLSWEKFLTVTEMSILTDCENRNFFVLRPILQPR